MKRYSTLFFEGIRKRHFSFPDEKRPDCQVKVGDIVSFDMLDDHGKPLNLEFMVRRNEEFPLVSERWIYGQVLYGENGCAQIEFRLNKKHPQDDTIEIFPYSKVVL